MDPSVLEVLASTLEPLLSLQEIVQRGLLKLRQLKTAFHLLGLSCLGSAVFLQTLVLTKIITQGYFMGLEPNPVILYIELACAIFTAIYYIRLCAITLKSLAGGS